MSELLSSITGGGGAFVSSFVSPTVAISSGATGTIATITPPTGERVKLTGLSAFTSSQTNLTTVTVGGVDVVVAVNLETYNNPPNSANEMLIGFENSNQDSVIGNVDDVFEIKTNVATSTTTLYTYQFGA